MIPRRWEHLSMLLAPLAVLVMRGLLGRQRGGVGSFGRVMMAQREKQRTTQPVIVEPRRPEPVHATPIQPPAPQPQPVYYVAQPPAQAPVTVNVVQYAGNQPVRQWSGTVAAILSLVIPGLGQMYKGQVLNGLVWFVVVLIGYVAFIIPGLVLHVLCILGAAMGDRYRR